MELECGGEKGGWMRIADLDTSRGDDCPTGWSSYTTPNDNPTYPSINVCKIPPEVDKGSGCYPATFSAYAWWKLYQNLWKSKRLPKGHD